MLNGKTDNGFLAVHFQLSSAEAKDSPLQPFFEVVIFTIDLFRVILIHMSILLAGRVRT